MPKVVKQESAASPYKGGVSPQKGGKVKKGVDVSPQKGGKIGRARRA
jgi:hypothetical protein